MAFPFSICIPETEILSFLRGAFPDHKERVRLRHYDVCENARTLITMIIWIFFLSQSSTQYEEKPAKISILEIG